MYRIEQLKEFTENELSKIAQKMNITQYQSLTKEDLVYTILDKQSIILDKPNAEAPKSEAKKTVKKKPRPTKPLKAKSIEDTSVKNTPKKTEQANVKKQEASTTKTSLKTNELDGLIEGQGVLEIVPDGYGFLRSTHYNYAPSPDDIYVSHAQIRSFDLKIGDTVNGKLRVPKDGEKYFGLIEPISINGKKLEEMQNRNYFENLSSIFPHEKLNITSSSTPTESGTRIIDLFCPIGKGQRALIVAPPKAGKTSLITDIATNIAKNHPEIYLIILLVDERVEEASYMKKKLNGHAEVVASTFDKKAESHIRLTEIVLKKAKRLVEYGHDVCIIADGITRIARAYNTEVRSSGKTLSGGVDVNALHKPKNFFGAARNIEDGGSLTIIATALVETGSRMDDLIFEEFKGTGNMECQLDRRLANKDIYPAIDVLNSKTRKEELLQSPAVMRKIKILRRAMIDMKPEEAMAVLLKNMRGTKNNTELLASMQDESY
ncbi:MAG: transcription termination factor Rho [Bacteroidota bacterium]